MATYVPYSFTGPLGPNQLRLPPNVMGGSPTAASSASIRPQAPASVLSASTKASVSTAPQAREPIGPPGPPAGYQAPGGGSGGNNLFSVPQSQPQQPNQADILAGQLRGEINSGYDSYFAQLDSILNEGLPSQRSSQEGIVNSQYDQGVNQLTTQRNLGLQDLNAERAKTEAAQAKTLKDIAGNIRNSFLAGNVYLGSRGAADSSAANQYSYALTKLGSQQRGDVNSQFADIQNDISGRESRLNEIYNGEIANLAAERDQKILSISSWFSEQQNALKQAQAQGQLSKGQDLQQLSQNLLNVALQQLQMVQSESANRRSALEQWAINNSQNINQLKSNFQQISTVNPIFPQAQPIAGTPQVGAGGNTFAPTGYGSSNEKTDIFGNPIR